MDVFPYSGIVISSKEGLEALLDFAKRNDLMEESIEVVFSIMISVENEIAAEEYEAMVDTLRDAMPNCFD